MFYATGSIYECDGKWCLPEVGSASPVPDQPGATSSEGATGASDTTAAAAAESTDSNGHVATPAVSIPGVNKGETGASTVVETATASDGSGTTGTAESSTPAEGSENGAKSREGAWGTGMVVGALGVLVGAGGLL